MNPLPTPTLQDLRWKFLQSASNGTPFPSQTIQVATIAELESAAADMLQTQKALRDKNKDAVLKGVQGKSVTLLCNECVLRVTLEKTTKRAQDVKPTSKEAYHTIDFTTQRGKVAEAIFAYSRLGADVTRKELEVWQNLGSNVVCGRVKELLEMSAETPFLFAGKPYVLQIASTRLSKCKGASEVKNEALQWMPVKQPADEGAQIEMFT